MTDPTDLSQLRFDDIWKKKLEVQHISGHTPNIHHAHPSLTPLVPSAFGPRLTGELGTAGEHHEKKNEFKRRKRSRLRPGKHVQELPANRVTLTWL